MTDRFHFDPKIFLFTIFPTISDFSIFNSPFALLSTVDMLKIHLSVETKLQQRNDSIRNSILIQLINP